MKTRLVIAAALLASGCGTTTLPSPPTWTAAQRNDPFTDTASCRVTLSGAIRMDVYRGGVRYYPYVEKRGDEVRVGLMSHPLLPVPTGRVQLRIDDLPAWTIEPSETPVDTAAFTPGQLTGSLPANADPAARDALQQSAAAMASTITQSTSPYTTATGEKAAAILAEIRSGSRLIYRVMGANAASSTGEAPLGSELNDALVSCGL